MQILYLTPYTPTPIRTRPYNLLKALACRGHDITLLCIAQGEGLHAKRPSSLETAALDELRALGIRAHAVVLPRLRSLFSCLRALLTSLPLQAVYCWSPALARLLRDELSSGDYSTGVTHSAPDLAPSNIRPVPCALSPKPYALLHIEHLRGARYGLWLQALSSPLSAPIVWDSVDSISHLFAQSARTSRNLFGRLVTRVELPRTRRYEAALLRRFDRTLVTSPRDAAALEALANQSGPELLGQPSAAPGSDLPAPCSLLSAPISILPNGVDLAYFSPDGTPRRPGELVFSGKMSYHANVSAAIFLVEEVLPLIRQQRTDAHLTIVGSNPPPEVRALASPHVSVTGHVPDLRPYLRRSVVAVAPMPYGAGIQNKVLEAMACATPVVATPQAISALAARPAEEASIGETPEQLAGHVVRLLADPPGAEQLGRAGRAYVERHHDWDRIAGSLEQVYQEEIARRQGVRSSATSWAAAPSAAD